MIKKKDKQTIPAIAATDEALSVSAALVAAVATDIGFIVGWHIYITCQNKFYTLETRKRSI